MAFKKKDTNSGKGIRGAVAYQAELAKQMSELYQYQHWMESLDEDEFDFVSLTMRGPKEEGGEFLAVVRAWVAGEQMVGFHGGSSLIECFLGVSRRMKNGSMKWKADEYAR